MSIVVAEGVVEVTADADGVSRDVARAIDGGAPAVAAAGGRTGGGFLKGFGAAFAVGAVALALGGLTQGIQGALDAGFDFAKQGVDYASELEQNLGAAEAVFDDHFGFIEEKAEGAYDAVGLSARQYTELANVLGSQLKNGGTAIDEIADKTDGLIGLGADMSAMFGGTAADAVGALSSALRGERDPIEKYGVSLTQAAIDAEAARLGFEKVNGTLSTQASQAATLSLITQQTADAQGRFAAEGDTLAGSQQRLQAAYENSQAKLGEALLPALTELSTFATENLIPVLDQMIEEIGPILADALEESMPALLDLADAFVELLPDLVTLGVELLPVLVDLLIVIAPLIADWATNTVTLMESVDNFFGLLSGDTSMADFAATAENGSGSMFDFAKSVGTSIGQAIGNVQRFAIEAKANIDRFFGFINSIPGTVRQALVNAGGWLYNAGRDVIQGLINGVTSMIAKAKSAIVDIGAGMMNAVKGFFGIRSPSVKMEVEVGAMVGEGQILGYEKKMRGWRARIADTLAIPAPSIPYGAGAALGETVAGGGNGSTTSIIIEHLTVDAASITEVADFLAMLKKLPQAARSGQGRSAYAAG